VTRWLQAGTTQIGEASHRGHRGHGGELIAMEENRRVTRWLQGEYHANRESIARRSQRPRRGRQESLEAPGVGLLCLAVTPQSSSSSSSAVFWSRYDPKSQIGRNYRLLILQLL
jgi:hypothetical protein